MSAEALADATGVTASGEAAADTDLQRFQREGKGRVSRVEYELWKGQVYRIRWQLAAAFERPLLDELRRAGSACFGVPVYDQTFEAEPGSASATLRRIGWHHGDREIELRQLHPLRGGPVYLSVTLRPLVTRIGLEGRVPFPQPERSGPWWTRSQALPEPLSEEERERLAAEFIELLSQIDHGVH